MAHPFLLVDVFTERAFSGNQLAVFWDASEIDSRFMQPFARELNFSETVFVLPPEDPENTARLRIFTPEAEVPFAGHPVIGTAFALEQKRDDLRDDRDLRFEVEAGLIQVRRYRSDSGRLLQAVMNQRRPTFLAEMVSAEEVALALGIPASEILITGLPCQVVSTGLPAKSLVVGSSAAFEMWEVREGVLQVTEPRLNGVEVAVVGYVGAIDLSNGAVQVPLP
jgi:trans-2,3-dihydro-3-hydroxyanthranilate isomerase